MTGILPPATKPPADLKPFFTIRDAAQGTVYYTVTWTQVVADIGETLFPTAIAHVKPDLSGIVFEDDAARDAVAHFLPVMMGDDDA